MQAFQAKGIKINFDGQGSDELFGGYQKHYNCFLWEAAQYGDFKIFLNNTQPPYFNSFNSPVKAIKQLSKTVIQKASLLDHAFMHAEMKYLQPSLIDSYKDNLHKHNQEEALQPLNQFLHQQFCGPDLKVLLRTGDRNSMRFGVETRTPFADDHLLIEKIFSLSASIKIKNGYSKFLLRESSKNILPETIRTRRDKIGYATPEISWLKTMQYDLYDLIPDQDDEFIKYSLLKKDWVSLIPNLTEPARLWRILNFMRWKTLSEM